MTVSIARRSSNLTRDPNAGETTVNSSSTGVAGTVSDSYNGHNFNGHSGSNAKSSSDTIPMSYASDLDTPRPVVSVAELRPHTCGCTLRVVVVKEVFSLACDKSGTSQNAITGMHVFVTTVDLDVSVNNWMCRCVFK